MSTVRVIQNKQRLTKEGNAPLYITFYLGKEKLMLPCKVAVPAAKLDEKSGLLKPRGHPCAVLQDDGS